MCIRDRLRKAGQRAGMLSVEIKYYNFESCSHQKQLFQDTNSDRVIPVSYTHLDVYKRQGVYCGYNTYYGGNGISTQAPVFEYTYNGTYYREQTTQNISHKRLNKGMTQGKMYSIYIDPKHPTVFILAKKIKIGTIVAIILGLFIFTYGIDLLLKLLPMLLSR